MVFMSFFSDGMTGTMKSIVRIFCALSFLALWMPFQAQAHQPRIVDSEKTEIRNPEISQAFYGELQGTPKTFVIESDKDFVLYLQLLVPKMTNADARYSAVAFESTEQGRIPVASISGESQEWKEYHEEFANDVYLQSQGTEYQARSGKYEVDVFGNGDSGKFVLVIGKAESFPASEIWNALVVVPQLKKEFFHTTPLTLVWTKFGAIGFAVSITLNVLAWLLFQYVAKRILRRDLKERNMGKGERYVRLAVGLALLVLSIHLWSGLIFFLSGALIATAVSGWCLYYVFKTGRKP